MSDELWRWDAVRTAKAIRTGAISSREAAGSCLARLEAVNPYINAVVDVLADDALAAADAADAALRRGDAPGPLHGVPVTVKINVDYAGRATTNGVVAFKDAVAAEDSASVANLRKAGAVVVGRTNVPAFSTRYFTDNALHGRTLNPWAPDRTPGGSSGGAAAAVAAGIGAIGHGNDRAGSVRYPAYACGVYGLRPSVGRVPEYNPGTREERGLSSQITQVQGPLARTVADVRLGLDALAARDPRDPWWVPAASEGPSPKRPVVVAMVSSLADTAIDPAVTEAVQRAGRMLGNAGYRVEEIAPPRFGEAAEMFWSLLMTEERAASENERAASTRGIQEFGDEAVKRARLSTRACATQYEFEDYIRALARRSTILREWQVFLEDRPLILMPVSWQLPYPVDHDQKGDEAVRAMLEAHKPMLAISVLGLPGLSVPMGLSNGVPVGVQIVGGRFREDMCLAAGEAIEAQCPMSPPVDPKGLPR